MAKNKDSASPKYQTAFKQALRDTLDWARQLNDDNWRSLSGRLDIGESETSQYRHGGRYPSVTALLTFEEAFPGFMSRLTTLFDRYLRDMQ